MHGGKSKISCEKSLHHLVLDHPQEAGMASPDMQFPGKRRQKAGVHEA